MCQTIQGLKIPMVSFVIYGFLISSPFHKLSSMFIQIDYGFIRLKQTNDEHVYMHTCMLIPTKKQLFF